MYIYIERERETNVYSRPVSQGPHKGMGKMLFADFIGTQHNIQLSHGVAVATRCTDANIVLLRSVKGIEFPK